MDISGKHFSSRICFVLNIFRRHPCFLSNYQLKISLFMRAGNIYNLHAIALIIIDHFEQFSH